MPRHTNRRKVEVAEPYPGKPRSISMELAIQYCQRGIAYFLRDGSLRFRSMQGNPRQGSDVYVGERMVYWNGADTRRCAMHKPGENVQIVKPYIAALKAGL